MSRATYILVNGKLIAKTVDGEVTNQYRKYMSNKPVQSVFSGFGSDNLPGGVEGIINHADGKRYDSKSQYERAVKAKGCRIVGNDWNNKDLSRKEIHGDYNVRPQLKQAVEKVLGR